VEHRSPDRIIVELSATSQPECLVGFPDRERSVVNGRTFDRRSREMAGNRRQALAAISRFPSIVLVDLGSDDALRPACAARPRKSVS